MVWRAVARKEVRDLLRPRTVKVGLGFVVATFVVGGYLLPTATADPTTADYAGYMTQVVVLVVPIAGLLLGYKTIVAERTSGRMALLLSLPNSRTDAVVGKFLGRLAVLGTVLAGGILTGAALAAYPFGVLEPWTAVGYVLATFLFGTAFLSVGIAISTATRSSRLATVATFGAFFLFVVVWVQLGAALRFVLDYFGATGDGLPDWALFVHGLEPTMLYRRIAGGLLLGVEAGPYLGPDAAWYLGAWPALALLAAWTLAPVGVGYLQFRRTDL